MTTRINVIAQISP